MPIKSVLAVGDMHLPYCKQGTIDRVISLIRYLKPQRVIQMGDLFDMFSFSRFPRTHNLITPEREIELGRRDAERFWKRVRQAAPKAELFQLRGNHDARPAKRVLEQAPELECFVTKGLAGLWDFHESVITMPSDREELMLDGIVYHHGWGKPGAHMEHNQRSTVIGHLHRGYTLFRPLGNKVLWELNAGFIANPQAIPLSYGAQKRFRRETQGVGWVDKLGPRFIVL